MSRTQQYNKHLSRAELQIKNEAFNKAKPDLFMALSMAVRLTSVALLNDVQAMLAAAGLLKLADLHFQSHIAASVFCQESFHAASR